MTKLTPEEHTKLALMGCGVYHSADTSLGWATVTIDPIISDHYGLNAFHKAWMLRPGRFTAPWFMSEREAYDTFLPLWRKWREQEQADS